MTDDEWPQRVLSFRSWPEAEQAAAQHLLPALAHANVPQWSFIRKHPVWRLRFPAAAFDTTKLLDNELDRLVHSGVLQQWTPSIYEPETPAFGGRVGVAVAHGLFHRDSLNTLAYLKANSISQEPRLGRRELGLCLPSVMMRAAGLDWFEQGDVWAKVADLREEVTEPQPRRLRDAAARLMTVYLDPDGRLPNGPLASISDWAAAFANAGQQLSTLNRFGLLERGLRAVLAHHVIFHWNRLGLSHHTQSILSHLAKEEVMGSTDNIPPASKTPGVDSSLNEVSADTSTATVAEAEQLRKQLVDQLLAKGSVTSAAVEKAMRSIPRHLFLPDVPLAAAYADSTVNIKHDADGRPISCASQPSVVALMLEQLRAQPGDTVFEAGLATGINAAYLAHIVGPEGHVYSKDVDQDLVDRGRRGLRAAGIRNVSALLGDGALGHVPAAPFDRIIATVGAHGVPHAWHEQLTPGGRLVVPLRLRGSVSRSIAFERDGELLRSVSSAMNTFMPLRQGIADDVRRYVPLTSDHTVTLVANSDQDVEPDVLADVLTRPRTETWSGVAFRGPESAEYLELWLACTLPNALSYLTIDQKAIDSGLLTDPYRSSTATFEDDTLTYLTRRKADHTAPDGAALYEFGVIGHGPGRDKLADRVVEEIRTWDRDYRSRHVRFEVQALHSAPPATKPGRFAFDNPLNRIVIEWH